MITPEGPRSKTITPFEGGKYALVVGVNNTKASSYLPDLRYAEEDAHAIYHTLRQQACNFTFLNPVLTGDKAETRDIRRAVIKLAQQKADQNFLLFYFIGHAQPIKTKEGGNDIYFVTYDFSEDEVKEDPTAHLSMHWLHQMLYRPDSSGGVLIILDCCYAGNAIHSEPDPFQIDLRKVIQEYIDSPDVRYQNGRLRVILTATGFNTPAQERIMTPLILSALQGNAQSAIDDKGHVNIHSLYTYLQDRMPDIQLPNLSGDFSSSCILAHYPEKSSEFLQHLQQTEDYERWSKVSQLIESISEVSKVITDPNHFKLLAEANTRFHAQQFDQFVDKRASIADLDQEKVTEFFKRDRVQIQDDFDGGASNQDQLRHFNLLQETCPTYGALLCFGVSPTKWLPGAFTRCTLWSGSDRDLGWLEAQDYRRDLITQFESARNFLRKHLPLIRIINERVEEPDVPHIALEEALANALVHREYANQTSPIYVDIFNNRVEISSPGLPPEPMTLEILEQEHKSHPRNPQIARIFYLYKYVEKVGSGIRRMQHAMEKAEMPPAKFEIGMDKIFKVTFYRTGYEELAFSDQDETYRLPELAQEGLSSFNAHDREISPPSSLTTEHPQLIATVIPNENMGAFRENIRRYLRTSGYLQNDLANEIGLHTKVLSRKLHGGEANLTQTEVKRMIVVLARWGAISTREEVLRMLRLAGLELDIFSDQEWQTPPLSQLEEGEQQHNLPTPLTRFVGREEQVERLRKLLTQDETRLVTLVGPGGSGKTRLALHVASELTESFAQGIWAVMLAAVNDPALVLQSIMQTLYIQLSPDSSPVQSLITYLRHKKLLLILDNFEQVMDAAKLVGELLAAAPGLKVLVTSRAVLRLSGERELEVPPMNLPDPALALNREGAIQYDAVQLFVERARLVDPDFALTDENAPTIARICARVDGLPLALELAAVRIKSLTPEKLLERLSGARLAVLKGGRRDLPGRQQTLLKTIQWSYDLLSPDVQAWFARLGIFDGGWSLDAVEAMMQALTASPLRDDGDLPLSDSALDLLDHLLNNSLLVKPVTKNSQGRFIMLETLREYALARLKEHGEIERVRDWHACYYLGLAEQAEQGLRGAQQLAWLAQLRTEQDNFRAALEWSLEKARDGLTMSLKMSETGPQIDALEVSLRIAAALRPFWEWQGYLVEGRYWLKAALEMPLPENAGRMTLAARAKALSCLARLYCLQNEQKKCVTLADESIALWRQLDDPRGLAMALFYRAWPPMALGDYELPKTLFEQALQLLSLTDDPWLCAQIIFLRGDLAGFTGDYELMHSCFAQSKAIFEQIGDRSAIADLLKDQGGMAILEGNYEESIATLLQSIKMIQELGFQQFLGTGMGLLGFAVGIRGEPDPITASVQAAQLWGASNGLLGAIDSPSWLTDHPTVQDMVIQIRARVDDTTWKDAYRRGRSLTAEQALVLAYSVANVVEE